MNCTSSFRRSGFTLWEITVVLGVVALLSALLLLSVFSARARGRTATCASNLRQIGIALNLYVADADGYYPLVTNGVFVPRRRTSGDLVDSTDLGRSVTWHALLRPYLGDKEMPVCPDVGTVALPENSVAHQQKGLISGYSFNGYLSAYRRVAGGSAQVGIQESQQTGTRVVVFDARPFIVASRTRDRMQPLQKMRRNHMFVQGYADEILQMTPGAERHQGGANYLYSDGHVKWRK